MKTQNRKGFTIVELVIVIAVIAILAAVLIPTFAGLVNKANVASDTALIKNLNTALAADTDGCKTMAEALAAADEYGYNVAKINAKGSGNEILWDSVNNVFCYFDSEKNDVAYIPDFPGAEEANDIDYWVVAATPNEKYSTYLYGYEGDGTVTTTKGLDVGECIVSTINYSTTEKQTAYIYTTGGELNVDNDGTDGEVIHFGSLESASVTTDNECFITNGHIASLELNAGKVVAKADAIVALTKVAEGALVEKESNGVIFIADGTSSADIKLDESALTALGYTLANETITANEETKTAYSYKIGSKADLIKFRDEWNTGKLLPIVPFVLTADIDITGEQWAPIGNWKYPFNGVFDGNGYTIKGLTATKSLGADGVYAVGNTIGYGETFGFFGIAGNGDLTVKNVTFDEVNIDLNNGLNVGTVVGYVPNANKFKSDGATYADNKWADDTSVSQNELHFENITIKGSVKASRHVGGVVGKLYGGTTVEFININNYADVTSEKDNASGIVAYQHYEATAITFNDCHNYGNIEAGASSATALIGVNDINNKTITIYNNCTSTETVTLTGGGNTLGKFNEAKNGIVLVKRSNEDLKGAYLIGAASNNYQPTIETVSE